MKIAEVSQPRTFITVEMEGSPRHPYRRYELDGEIEWVMFMSWSSEQHVNEEAQEELEALYQAWLKEQE